MVDEGQEGKSKVFILFTRIYKRIEDSGIEIHELYRQQDIFKKNALTIKEFTSLIKVIDSNLNEQEIKILFDEFDLNNDGAISFNEYYSTLCKIAGIATEAMKSSGKMQVE